MSNEKFKVKFGLAVGDTAATIDATTGDIYTTGDIQLDGNTIKSNGGTTVITLNGNSASIAGDLGVDGGDLTIGGNGYIYSSSNLALQLTGADVRTPGDLQIDGGDLVMNSATANVANTVATTVNFAGAATTVSIGANTGTTTVNNSLVADDISILTVDTTNLEVTNIKAKDGTAAATIADTTGIITVSTELNVDNINISGNTVASTSGNNLALDPDSGSTLNYGHMILGQVNTNAILTTNGTGNLDIRTGSNPTSANINLQDGANGNITIDTDGTGQVIINADLDVNANITGDQLQIDNININGNSIISTDTNGNIGLTPNGTGDVALTFNNGGNLTNTRNYVFGAIRNTTTDSNGDIWVLDADSGGSGTLPYRGVSIDNSADTAKNAGTLLRNYSNTSAFAGRLIFERARGTAASPTTLSSGDQLGAIGASGYSSTLGWINDTLPVQPANMVFQTAEAWVNNTNLGTNFVMSLAPTNTLITAASNLVPVINHNPQAATYRSDAFTFRQGKTSTTDLLTLGTSSATLSADSITFRKSAGTNLVTIASDGTVRMKDPSGYSNDFAFYQPKTAGGGNSLLGLNQVSNNLNKFPQFSFFNYPSTDGINFTPTQNGQVIGGYKFNGNAVTGTTPGVPAGPAGIITVIANENWTSTANGATINFSGIKKGAITDVNFLSLSSDSTVFRADSYTFQDSSSTTLATVTATAATFTQPVGFPVKTAAQWNAITGSVGQQVCVSDSAGGSNPNGMMAFWDTTNNRWSYIHDNSAV